MILFDKNYIWFVVKKIQGSYLLITALPILKTFFIDFTCTSATRNEWYLETTKIKRTSKHQLSNICHYRAKLTDLLTFMSDEVNLVAQKKN